MMNIRRAMLLCLVLVFMLSLGFGCVSATDSNIGSERGLDQDLSLSYSIGENSNQDLSLSYSIGEDSDENILSDSINHRSDGEIESNADENIQYEHTLKSDIQDGTDFKSNILKDDSKMIYVSPDGDDENDGLTRDKAVGNISKAVSLAGDGYTIYLLNGVYNQNKSTQLSKNLYFIAEDGAIINRTGTSNVFTYTKDTIGTVSFKNIIFVSDTPNPSNPILSMAGRANLVVDNCTFTNAIAGKNGIVRLMGDSTGKITNTRFIALSGSTNAGSSYLHVLGDSRVIVDNCIFANISESMLRACVYVNNPSANLTLINSLFTNISGNLYSLVDNKGYLQIKNCNFTDNSLSGNGPRGIIWSSEYKENYSSTYINSSIFYNNSINTEVPVNSSIIQSKSPTVVEYCAFLNNDVDFIINNDNKTNITANYNWWGTNQNPKNCSVSSLIGYSGEGESVSLVSDDVTIDNWAIMTVEFESADLIANEEYPIIININEYMDEDGEISPLPFGINSEILLCSQIAHFNSSSIIYIDGLFNQSKVFTRNGTVSLIYRAGEEGSDILKIKSGYEEIVYNLEIGKGIDYIDIYVSKSGDDGNDGRTNGTAVLTIERALEIAKSVSSNVKIHISQGTYKESGFELDGSYNDEENIAKRTIYSFIGYGNVVIDGNGASLSIFSIRNNSASFRNIRFTNVNGATRGGAINVRINDNGYLYEDNAKIYADLTLNNCTFDNINVTNAGAALYYEYGSGRISINNTKFYNLRAQSSQGGAINIQESHELAKLKMTRCEFKDNFANNAGAAYLRVSDVTIKDSIFYNNSAQYYPGAIQFYNASANIENCVISNSSSKRQSAAIEIDEGSDDEGNLISIKSCLIENNTASDDTAPAIYVYKGVLNISHSSLVNDLSIATRTYSSGANPNQQGIVIANNNWWGQSNPFGENEIGTGTYLSSLGSAVNGTNITIDSWVILNVEFNDTGVLKVGNIVNISMDFNHVNTSSGEIELLTGGKIPKEYAIRLNATGGRIYPTFIRTVNGMGNSIFTVVDTEGLGDNFSEAYLDIKSDNEITNVFFEINNYKGVIFLSPDGDDNKNGSADSPVRTIEKAIQLAIDEEYGSHEIFVLEGTFEVCGVDLDYTYLTIRGSGVGKTIFDGAGYTGGMFQIYESNLTVKNLTVVNGVNTVQSGGAFTNMGNLTLDTVNVSNCQVKNVNGAVIYSVGNLNLINSSFVDNIAKSGNYASGGVIYTDGYYSSVGYPPSLNITDCDFISNTAGSISFGGGAIYMQYVDGYKSIKNTRFINNQAYSGGAIALQNSQGDFIMDNVSFIGNRATGGSNCIYGGGALSLIGATDHRVGNITIINSEFINNSAKNTRGGGAIFDRNVDLNLSNSVIINNKDSDKNIQIYKDTTVYLPNGGRISLEDNWWGVNDLSSLSTLASNVTIGRWVVMDVSVEINDSPSYGHESGSLTNEYVINVNLNRYSDGSLIEESLSHERYYPFERAFKLESSTGSFNPENGILVNNTGRSIFTSYTKNNTLIAVIDNQSIEFNTADMYVNTIIGLEFESNCITTRNADLNISLTDILSNPINGTVILSINGNEETIDLTDGKASVEIKDLNNGINNISVSFKGKGKYLESDNSTLIEVRVMNVNLSLFVQDIVVGESSEIKLFLFDEFGNPLSIPSDLISLNVMDKNYSVGIDEGKGSILIDQIDKEGQYLVTVKFDSDEYEGNKSCEAFLTVYGIGNVTVKHTGLGDASDIQAAIDAASLGDIIQLGNYGYTNVSDVNVTKSVTLAGTEGTTIESAGNGAPIFRLPEISENGPLSVNICGIDFKLNNRDIVLEATAKNDTENPLSIINHAINITCNTFETISEDVVAESVNILYLESDRGVLAPTNEIRITDNTISAGVNPFKFEVSSVVSDNDAMVSSLNITPKRLATVIEYSDMVTTAVDGDVDGRAGEYFKWKLVDSDGNPIAGKRVQIGFNGKIYNRTTNATGEASLQINLGSKGDYTFAISFLGDDDYNASFVVAKIKVNAQKGSLTVPSKSYAASAKTKALTATFKSASGKVVAKKKITFTVNGKTYTATTNAKGVATVKVSLNKKGTYSFTAKFAGDNRYAAITKTAKLVIK